VSLTPTYKPADAFLKYARFQHKWSCVPTILIIENEYLIDQGSEYKDYPRTKEGWEALCEDLKGFEP